MTARPQYLLTRHRNRTGYDARALRRAHERGALIRLRSGAYVRAEVWSSLTVDDRKRLEIAAAAELLGDRFTATHRSAAALWGMPTLTRHDGLVHTRVTTEAGTRNEHGYRKHAVRDLDLHRTVVDGIGCTSIERTVIDLAATEPFAEAVVAADWALRRTTKERLLLALDEWAPARGRRRIEGVIAFADPRSGSAGESFSRVQMDEGGLVMPELQTEFGDRTGLIGFVDFFWPEFGLIGEFDGLVKYVDPSMLAGRTPQQALTDEKLREDRLRATGRRVSRWAWQLLRDRTLVAHLRAAGVRLR